MPPPLLGSAHVIVSAATRGNRARAVEMLARSVGPLTASGRVELVEAYEPDAPAIPGDPPLVDIDPAHLEDDEGMRPMVGPMHQRHLSNALKHYAALRSIADAPGPSGGSPRFSAVLEDDALFADGQMQDAVRRASEGAPADAGIVFLGLPSPGVAPAPGEPARFQDVLVAFKDQVVPACESYLVTPAAAAALVAAFLPVRVGGAAAQLTMLLRRQQRLAARGVQGVRAYVASPNAFVDGSKIGAVTSSLHTNNRLLWNQAYCAMDEVVRRARACPSAAAYDPSAFEKIWAGFDSKEHPDALVLFGDHNALAGRHVDAEEAYEKALQAYTRDGCLVDRSSEFMKRYMALYAHLS